MVKSMIPLPTAQNPDGLTPAQVEELQTMPPFNVLWMLARTGWLDQIMALLAVMFKPGDFPARDREIMVLRISHLLGADYPIAQHQFFGRTAGLTNEDIDAILRSDTSGLDLWTAQLCALCDEISKNATLSENSVRTLCEHYGRNGAAQAIWLMSWFNMLARFTTSTRVPIETPATLAAATGGSPSIASG